MTAENSSPAEPDGPTVKPNLKGVCCEDNLAMGVQNMVVWMREMAELYPNSGYAWSSRKEAWAREHEAFIGAFAAAGCPSLTAHRSDPELAVTADGRQFKWGRAWSAEEDEQVVQLQAEMDAIQPNGKWHIAARDRKRALVRVASSLDRSQKEVAERITMAREKEVAKKQRTE